MPIGQDDAISGWQRFIDAVSAAQSEIEHLRADYGAKLAAIRTKRAEAVRGSIELLAAVAVLGDDNDTARLLDVPLRHVSDARRSTASGNGGEAPEAVLNMKTSKERTLR